MLSTIARWVSWVLIALSAFGAMGCTHKNKARTGELAKIEKRLFPVLSSKVNKPSRAIAKEKPVCLKDRGSIEQLRADTRELEAGQTSGDIRGFWQSLDLSKIPALQASYINQYSQWLETKGVDFSGCEDLICVLSRIYNDPTDLKALKHYWWYLKMGYALSTTNTIPKMAAFTRTDPATKVSTPIPYSEFLFNDHELDGFWLLTQTLSAPYQHMNFLQSLHRFPPFMFSSDSPDACGVNWTYRRIGTDGKDLNAVSGYIWLMDKCLTLRESDPKSFENYFYSAVSHELSHSTDWRFSAKGRKSETDEWLDFSGWWIDESTDAKGNVTRQWRLDARQDHPQSATDGFVDDYAKTNPNEDWAETNASFRYRAPTALSKSPVKSAWISKNVYDGRTFDASGLSAYYAQFTQSQVSSQVLHIVNSCLIKNDQFAEVESSRTASVHFNFDFVIEQPILDCIKRGLLGGVDQAFFKLRETEYEACDFLDQSGSGLQARVIQDLQIEVGSALVQQSEIANQLKAVNALRETLQSDLDPREAYLACSEDKDPQQCYQNAISSAIEKLAKPLIVDLGEALQNEKNFYLKGHTFNAAQDDFGRLFDMILSGIEPRVDQLADSRWKACRIAAASIAADAAGAGSEPIPKLIPFSGGEHFVSAPILNCINDVAISETDALRDRFTSRLGIQISGDHAQTYARRKILGRYLADLSTRVEEESNDEDQARESRKAEIIASIVRGLVNDIAWLGAPPHSQDSTRAACESKAMQVFSEVMAALPAAQTVPTRFAAIEDLRLAWSKEACSKAYQDPAITSIFEEERKHRWREAMLTLESLVLFRSEEPANKCVYKYPGKNLFSRRLRRTCLLTASTWRAIKGEALGDWGASDNGREFAFQRNHAAAELTAQDSRLQEQAVEQMESSARLPRN